MNSALRHRFSATLTSWPFAICLGALILNDAWLKQAFPGWLTGKLSDFAGVAVVALLLLAAAPRHRRLVCVSVALAFAFWKSAWSQPMIDALNLYLPWPVRRVVDYTDLLALSVLPPCARFAGRIGETGGSRWMMPARWPRRLLLPPLLLATVFGITATSIPRTMTEFRVSQRNPSAELNHTAVAAAVAEAARKIKLVCEDCAQTQTQARYSGDGVFVSYSFPDGRTVRFLIEAYGDAMLTFPHHTWEEKKDRVIKALTQGLSRVYTDLAFEESPRPMDYRPPDPSPAQ
jgi:hypothetical protein